MNQIEYNSKLSAIEGYIHLKEYVKAIDELENIIEVCDMEMLDSQFYYLKGRVFEDNQRIDLAKEAYWTAVSKKTENINQRYKIVKALERVLIQLQECKTVYCLYGKTENNVHVLQPLNSKKSLKIPVDMVCVKDELQKNDFVDLYVCGELEIPTSIELVKRVNEKKYNMNDFSVYEGNDSYIFISYSHKDEQEVLHIINALQNQGYRIWFDRGIEAGTEWPQNIAEHILNSACVISIMSKNAAQSQNCRNEINFALKYNKSFITIYLEEFDMELGLQLQLDSKQAIFKNRNNDFNSFIEELTNTKLIKNCK